MDISEISDGTVTLRRFEPEDRAAAVTWLSGPDSRQRAQTDGGPAVRPDQTDQALEDLATDVLMTVVVDQEAVGLLALDHLRNHTDLRLILARPALWPQGIGGRVIRLAQRLAFEQDKSSELQVRAVCEDASAARMAWEDAGFAIQRRYVKGAAVYLDLALSRRCHQSREQRIHMVAHAATDPQRQMSLASLGRAQAEALADSALLARVAEVLVSSHPAAVATAEQACAVRGIPCTIDAAWSGQDLGAWADWSLEQIPRDAEGAFADPPQGEDQQTFQARVKHALEVLPHGGDVAVISHGDVVAAILRQLQPGLCDASGLRTGSGILPATITTLHRGPEGWRVIRIADDRHLQARVATTELGA